MDELVTVFVIRFPGHASFAAAPQVPLSLYYGLPKLSWAMFGDSEAALRLPSIVAMAAALYFIGRLAARLIHPLAGWFAVFACLAFRNFDYFAVDARPYGLGMAVAAASVLFLVRWFDEARWVDEAVFVALAALLWRIHLFYWPFYLVYAFYALLRRGDTKVSGRQIAVAVVALAAALLPIALIALGIARGAASHSFVPPPTLRNLFYLAHAQIVLMCLAVAWWRGRGKLPKNLALLCCWWLICPVTLFAYSRLTGNGVLIMRYASLMLPGLALTITAIAATFFPSGWWKPAALATGAVALGIPRPVEQALAGARTGRLARRRRHGTQRGLKGTPVLCISPFIEAQPPVWTPDYRTPGIPEFELPLLSDPGRHEAVAVRTGAGCPSGTLGGCWDRSCAFGEFITYGSTWAVGRVDEWLQKRPELSGVAQGIKALRYDLGCSLPAPLRTGP